MSPERADTTPPKAHPGRRSLARRLGVGLAKLVGFIALAVVLMIVVAGLRAPDLPDRAPEFTLRSLDGDLVRLADFRGRTVVLNFWATWCLPCRLELPALSRFARAHDDVVVLGLAAEDPELLRASAAEHEIAYPVLIADRATLAAYGIDTYPTTVIVGPEGEVRRAYTGLMLDPHLLWATR